MSDPFSTVEPPDEIPRDRWKRPLVVPLGGGKPKGFTRMTTFIGVLEDRYALEAWKMRMVALGLAERRDLLLAVTAHRDDKDKLNDITQQATEAAKASAGATTGTALHALTDRIDRGQEVGTVPAEYEADLDAYRDATKALEVVAIEQFGVLDEYEVGGTCDRIYRYQGRNYIGDTKTGSIQYGALKIAMQLAGYAHCVAYDHKTKTRTPLPDVDQDRAIVVHLPAGTGNCELHWVDIRAGWEDLQLAARVRQSRARKGLLTPFVAEVIQPAAPASADVAELIATAPTVGALTAIWNEHHTRWTPDLTDLAKARRTLLEGGVLA